MAHVTDTLITVERKDGPVYYLKARDRDGRQIKQRLGPVAEDLQTGKRSSATYVGLASRDRCVAWRGKARFRGQ